MCVSLQCVVLAHYCWDWPSPPTSLPPTSLPPTSLPPPSLSWLWKALVPMLPHWFQNFSELPTLKKWPSVKPYLPCGRPPPPHVDTFIVITAVSIHREINVKHNNWRILLCWICVGQSCCAALNANTFVSCLFLFLCRVSPERHSQGARHSLGARAGLQRERQLRPV